MLFTLKDIFYILLFAESILFALFSFTYKNLSSKPAKVLGVFMLVMALFFVVCFIYIQELPGLMILVHYLFLSVFLAITPFYYIYLKSLTSESFRVTWKLSLHFIPALFILLCLLVFFAPLSYEDKIMVVTKGFSVADTSKPMIMLNVYTEYLSLVIYYIQIIGYLIAMIILFRKHSKKIKEYFSYTEKVSLNWLKIFLVIFVINVILEISVIVLSGTHLFQYFENAYYFVLILNISFLGYFGIKQTDIYVTNLSHPKVENVVLPEVSAVLPEEEVKPLQRKYAQSTLSDDLKARIREGIDRLMNTDKLYLNPELSIDDLASALQTNKTYISQVLNEEYGRSFFYFINDFRIIEAKSLLTDEKYHHYSLDGIASLCGFNSRFVLTSAFKKITGQSPSAYRDAERKKISTP